MPVEHLKGEYLEGMKKHIAIDQSGSACVSSCILIVTCTEFRHEIS